MKKVILLFLLLNSTRVLVYSQSEKLEWKKCIGGSYDEYQFGVGYFGERTTNAKCQILRKEQDGYLIGGTTSSTDGDILEHKGATHNYDIFLIKLDSARTILWSKCYGGTNEEAFASVSSTHDNGYILIGSTNSTDGDVHGYHKGGLSTTTDLFIVKTDQFGNIIWTKTLGGTKTDAGTYITETKDGGYIACGSTESIDGDLKDIHTNDGFGVWIIKLDASGNVQWQKCFGNYGSEAYVIRQLEDDNYILGGITSSNQWPFLGNHGQSDLWVAKLNSNGDLIWCNCYGGSNWEYFGDIEISSNGGYILCGQSFSTDGDVNDNHNGGDGWIVKINESGNIEWRKCYGGSKEDGCSNIINIADGYAIIGYSYSNDGDLNRNYGEADIWVLNITNAGYLNWSNNFGSSGFDLGSNIINTIDGNSFIIEGAVTSNDYDISGNHSNDNITRDLWIAKLNLTTQISGIIFKDLNKNFVRDSEEPLMNNVKVYCAKDTLLISAIPTEGKFTFDIDTGTYNISAVCDNIYYSVEPADTIIKLDNYFTSGTVNFGFYPLEGKRDLKIDLYNITNTRPGFYTTYNIIYENVGTDTVQQGVIKLIKDNRLDIISSYPKYDSLNDDTLSWNFSDFKPSDKSSILITLSCLPPPLVNNGDTLRSVVTINSEKKDLDSINNTSYLFDRVSSSYDPNDKSENHAGSISKNNVTNGDYLTYTIRFQNTGTDTAFNIVVRDTLSDKLDWNTLQMVDASNDYQLNITDGNKCTWYFNNILLPDSNINEPASHGYIVYKIKPKSILVSGDVINNSASIYFDYNLPVQTNIAKTVVSDITLPLHLLSFSAQHNGKTNLLKWSTSNEINTDHFEIERSGNGRNFTTIGAVKSYNNGKSTNDYSFTDAQPLKAVNYYRLKMLDKDGKYTFSAIRSINNTNSFDVTLYPNPVKNNLTLNFSSEKAMDLQIEIVSTEGKLVLSKKIHITQGESKQTINTASLNAGNYFLKCTSAEGEVALRFVKQ